MSTVKRIILFATGVLASVGFIFALDMTENDGKLIAHQMKDHQSKCGGSCHG